MTTPYSEQSEFAKTIKRIVESKIPQVIVGKQEGIFMCAIIVKGEAIAHYEAPLEESGLVTPQQTAGFAQALIDAYAPTVQGGVSNSDHGITNGLMFNEELPEEFPHSIGPCASLTNEELSKFNESVTRHLARARHLMPI